MFELLELTLSKGGGAVTLPEPDPQKSDRRLGHHQMFLSERPIIGGVYRKKLSLVVQTSKGKAEEENENVMRGDFVIFSAALFLFVPQTGI